MATLRAAWTFASERKFARPTGKQQLRIQTLWCRRQESRSELGFYILEISTPRERAEMDKRG